MLAAVFDFLNGPVREAVTQVYAAVGYLGVALWVAIESVVIPIPSELVLPFAGFLVGEGRALEPLTGQPWNLALVTLAGTFGATVGALVAYGLGAWGGRPLIERWGTLLGITPLDLDRAESFFQRHGAPAAFFGRMIPVIRSLVSFGAGVSRMPLGPFVLYTVLGYDGFLPTTAHAAVEILKRSGIEIAGRRAIVIGRSNVVGKPAAILLLREHATVTICHSRTRDLASVVRTAEIVVVAAGRPGLVTGEMLKRGAVVVDIGINVVDDRIVGDVDIESARRVASAITPVPGGVGPVTNALLLTHLLRAAHAQAEAARRGGRAAPLRSVGGAG